MALNADERRRVDACVAEFEARTGTQVVAAIVEKSDDYPEVPWKAFALGVSLATLGLLVVDWLRPDWPGGLRTLVFCSFALGIGAALALLTLKSESLARRFLSSARAEAEVMQRAQVLFLEHELFRTGARNALLLFVSRFERRIVLLPDRQLGARMDPDSWSRVVDGVAATLREGRFGDALCGGLAAARDLLLANGFRSGEAKDNELSDAIIEEGANARR